MLRVFREQGRRTKAIIISLGARRSMPQELDWRVHESCPISTPCSEDYHVVMTAGLLSSQGTGLRRRSGAAAQRLHGGTAERAGAAGAAAGAHRHAARRHGGQLAQPPAAGPDREERQRCAGITMISRGHKNVASVECIVLSATSRVDAQCIRHADNLARAARE